MSIPSVQPITSPYCQQNNPQHRFLVPVADPSVVSRSHRIQALYQTHRSQQEESGRTYANPIMTARRHVDEENRHTHPPRVDC